MEQLPDIFVEYFGSHLRRKQSASLSVISSNWYDWQQNKARQKLIIMYVPLDEGIG